MPETIESHQVRDLLFDAVPWIGVGMKSWKVLRCNGAAENLLGFTVGSQQLVGTVIDDLVPPEDRDAHVAGRTAFAARPRPLPLGDGPQGVRCRRADGTVIRLDVGLYGNKEMFDRGFVVAVLRPVREVPH